MDAISSLEGIELDVALVWFDDSEVVLEHWEALQSS